MKNRIINSLALITVFTLLFLVFGVETAEAQCPMCRIAAETNLEGGGTAGKGLNSGILYMLMTPYLAVGLIGFVWWRNRKKDKDV
ncbi:MAG: hypothetical protein AAGI23_08980 [Bacteroidota bacterium]